MLVKYEININHKSFWKNKKMLRIKIEKNASNYQLIIYIFLQLKIIFNLKYLEN